MQGVRAPNVQIEPKTIRVSVLAQRAKIAYFSSAILLLRQVYYTVQIFVNLLINLYNRGLHKLSISVMPKTQQLKHNITIKVSTMFKKLYIDSRVNVGKPKTTYYEKSAQRKKIKDTSYSRLHKAKKTSPSSSLDFVVVSTDSYVYQGQWWGEYRNGQGIAMMKNGSVVVGHWQKDVLHGWSLIVTPFGALIYANFITGKINGWVIMIYRDKLVVANMYFEDRTDGPRIMFESSQKFWMASQFENNGKLIKITHMEKGQRTQLPAFTQNDELSDLFNELVKKKNYAYGFSKIKTVKIGSSDVKYIGFTNSQNLPQGLGVTYSQSQCFIGCFENGFLEHVGRMVFANGDIYHGELKNGQFIGHGIYYNPSRNITTVMSTYESGETEIIEEHAGYLLLDFEIRIGQKISKEDQITMSDTIQVLTKTLQKYYHQYYIEARQKQQEKYSNVSEEEESEDKGDQHKLLDQDMKNIQNVIVKAPNWISQNADAESQDMQSNQIEEIEKKIRTSTLKYTFSPKNQSNLAPLSNFNSLAIKQNEDPGQKEKFNLQNPKQMNVKRQLFLKQHNLESSKSLDVNQLTFRGDDKKRSSKQDKDQKDPQYIDFEQDIHKKSYDYVQLGSDKNSSVYSNIDEKLTGIMKKSSLRKKIFK